MTVAFWLTFFSYTIITAITPGPNNILAMNAASNYGMKQSRALLTGMYTGFCCVMFCCGVLGTALASFLPNVLGYLKYLGAVYILWLAWHIATSKPSQLSEEGQPESFLTGFLLQFVNVKIIIYGITVFAGFVLPNTQSMAMIALFIVLASLIGNSAIYLWALAGAAFTRFFQKHWQVSNIVMALCLVYSAVGLLMP